MATGKRAKGGRAHVASRGGRRGLLIGAAVLTAMTLIGSGYFLFRETPAKSDCPAKPLTLAASAEFAKVASSAARAINGDCHKLVVKTISTQEILDTAADKLPDLWIAGSPAPLQQFKASGIYLKTVAPAIASSPVLLAGGPTARPANSWQEVLTTGKVSMINPSFNGPSAMVLTAAAAEQPGITDKDLGVTFLSSAQRYGQAAAVGEVEVPKLADITATTTRLFPVDEHELMNSRKVNSQITPVVPATGPLLLKFPLVAFTSKLETYDVGAALAKWFHSAAGTKVLNANFFRNGQGDPMPAGSLVQAKPLPEVPDDTAATALRFWRVTSVPSSLLAVLDVSGSMKFASGDTTRLAIEMDAARAALKVFPGHARIGAWVFSENQGPNGQAWKQLAPIKRLDAKDGNRSHRAALLASVDGLPAITRGGTGLYSTTLAGYQKVLASFDPKYFNSLILMTDGANEEPNSIGLPKLLSELKALQDPNRRVRIIAIGMSSDADMQSLRKIAEVTGGRAYRADTPDEIIQVFQDALLSR